MKTAIVILAAGKGTRMRSALPKVLQPLAGRPMILHVLSTARALVTSDADLHVVLGHGAEAVKAWVRREYQPTWHYQQEQRGTGDALRAALPGLHDADRVLVLYGDVPLLRQETLEAFLAAVPMASMGLCTAMLDRPEGYGRLVRRQDGGVVAIREEADCSPEERALGEVNLGITLLPGASLAASLERLQPHNAQGEFYLTDLVALALDEGRGVVPYTLPNPDEALGVNDPLQLAHVERLFQRRQADDVQRQGLRMADPARFDLRGELRFGQDCWLEPNVLLEGTVRLGNRVTIGAGVCLKDVEIGDDVTILPYSHLDGASIGAEARVGPFARVRPGTRLGPGAHLGNFVEAKNVDLGAGSKANHLSYLGDAHVGARVNIGAGVITCNYDGVNKHRTEIGDDVFVGSDSQLIAPVTVGDGATIGAGSTITKAVAAGGLTLSRSPQKAVPHWQRPAKKPRST